LFGIVGYSYGGSGSTFKLPDLRGRVAGGIGTDGSTSNRAIGLKFGAETHTLSTYEMPSHNHSVYDPGHVHEMNNGFNLVASGGTTRYVYGHHPDYRGSDYYAHLVTTGNSSTGISINSAGNGGAHNNMQPTQFVGNYFIYAGQ
jgi:microcystin-dependent protein